MQTKFGLTILALVAISDALGAPTPLKGHLTQIHLAQGAPEGVIEVDLMPTTLIALGLASPGEQVDPGEIVGVAQHQGGDKGRNSIVVAFRGHVNLIPGIIPSLLGREPRHILKHLAFSLTSGGFAGFMTQATQHLVTGSSSGVPFGEKRDLDDAAEEGEEQTRREEYNRRASVFDALAKKIFEKMITAGGSGATYQPLRHRFRKIFGKAQQG